LLKSPEHNRASEAVAGTAAIVRGAERKDAPRLWDGITRDGNTGTCEDVVSPATEKWADLAGRGPAGDDMRAKRQ